MGVGGWQVSALPLTTWNDWIVMLPDFWAEFLGLLCSLAGGPAQSSRVAGRLAVYKVHMGLAPRSTLEVHSGLMSQFALLWEGHEA
jgi:hypothetical protein